MIETALSVYLPTLADGYELCQPINQRDFEVINTLIDGRPQINTWQPLAMRIIRKDVRRALAESDSPWLGSHALIFGRRAIKTLYPLLSEAGELLPLHCDQADVAMFNPTGRQGVLDETASDVVRFSSGRLMGVNRYVFRAESIPGTHLFKIPNLRVSPVFVGGEFVERWKSAGLVGLDFKKVWSNSGPH